MIVIAYLTGSNTRPNGDRDVLWTQSVEAKRSPMWWQERGLSFTSTGYGSRIPTHYMVKFNGRWRRVYVRIYSNIGTAYIGKWSQVGENITVDLEQ